MKDKICPNCNSPKVYQDFKPDTHYGFMYLQLITTCDRCRFFYETDEQDRINRESRKGIKDLV